VHLIHLVPEILDKKGLLEEEMKVIKEINNRTSPILSRTTPSSASEPIKTMLSTPSPPRDITPAGALKRELEKASANNSPVRSAKVAFVPAKPNRVAPLSQSVEVSPVGTPMWGPKTPEVGSAPNKKPAIFPHLRSSGSNDSLMMTRSEYAPSNRSSRDSVSSQQMYLFSNTNSKSVSKDSLMSDTTNTTNDTNVTHKTSISKNNSGNSLNARTVGQQGGSAVATENNVVPAAGKVITSVRPNNATANTQTGPTGSNGSGSKWISYRPLPTPSSK